MSEYVGLVKGKVHDKRETSEYYCGGCGYPVTDHDSYCRECGGALHEGMAKNRYSELFGSPVRAARTLASIVTADGCVDCALLDATCCRNKDAWLEWLRGDAE